VAWAAAISRVAVVLKERHAKERPVHSNPMDGVGEHLAGDVAKVPTAESGASVQKRHWELGYRSGFDGLRGVAVLLVIGQHSSIPPFESAGTAAGVVAFFVLSGFLITALLLDELDRTHHIDLVGFYLRRARRLFPALFVVLIAVGFAYAAGGAWSYIVSSVAPALLYVADIARASGNGMWLLGHTWSLAIEEQFYLLWPLALLFAPRRAVVPALLVMVPLVIAIRLALWQTPQAAYAPYAQADSLVVGCLLAFAIRAVFAFRVPLRSSAQHSWRSALWGRRSARYPLR